MSAATHAAGGLLHGKKSQRTKLILLGVVAVVAYVLMRRSSAPTSTDTGVPTTGLAPGADGTAAAGALEDPNGALADINTQLADLTTSLDDLFNSFLQGSNLGSDAFGFGSDGLGVDPSSTEPAPGTMGGALDFDYGRLSPDGGVMKGYGSPPAGWVLVRTDVDPDTGISYPVYGPPSGSTGTSQSLLGMLGGGAYSPGFDTLTAADLARAGVKPPRINAQGYVEPPTRKATKPLPGFGFVQVRGTAKPPAPKRTLTAVHTTPRRVTLGSLLGTKAKPRRTVSLPSLFKTKAAAPPRPAPPAVPVWNIESTWSIPGSGGVKIS